ncbi:hypothetical protein MNBD_DELTA02-94 [hydrothermal vent metagenome]|uniref:Uncharacterized protein n=1 Tax=hydrothermal vent metagenome TaxID=652676 RepID=A0A3B0UZX7_9ZZZZ
MVIYKKIRIVVFIIASLVLLSSFTRAFAEDNKPYYLEQGVVSTATAEGFILNEHVKVFVLPDTKVFSSSEKELAQGALKGHRWVYVEGPVDSYGNVEAKSIYLMPRYIRLDERSEYPFIKTP